MSFSLYLSQFWKYQDRGMSVHEADRRATEDAFPEKLPKAILDGTVFEDYERFKRRKQCTQSNKTKE